MDEAAVWAEYNRLGYDQGWVFAMTPLANLAMARAVVVGLNPGGDDDQGIWESSGGNAYFAGRWIPGTDRLMPIQTQIAGLHELLDLGPNDVFAGQFIPFRSVSLSALAHQTEAFGFALKLWTWVISQTPASLYLCLGKAVAYNIASLLDAKPDGRWPSGWGTTTVGRYVSASGKVVVELPHLSRYLLFSMGPEQIAVAKKAILTASRPAELPPEPGFFG
jgi:hypothetical protein